MTPEQETLNHISSVIRINDVAFDDAKVTVVKSIISKNNSASTFSATFDNINGRHKDSFTIGDEIAVFGDDTVNANAYHFPYIFDFVMLNKLFNGLLEDQKFIGKGLKETVTIKGRDFTSRLQDTTVRPVVFNNTEISVIVKAIVSSSTSDITTNNVNVTSVTVSYIAFNHTPLFDALRQLADLATFTFFVDTEKDLNFKAEGSTSSGLVLNNTNILSSNLTETDNELVNKVWVYGDRQLSGAQDLFTADGGSVYNLTYKPHNTEIFVGGSTVPLIGGIFELVSTITGSAQYLVQFDERNIIFVSGATTGDFVPTSGVAFKVDYKRSVPIVKFGQDNASVSTYGPRNRVIVDKNIKDPNLAEDTVKDQLARNSQPRKQGKINIKGVLSVLAGQSIEVDIPSQNINTETFNMLEVSYNFTVFNNIHDKVMSIKVSEKKPDLLDTVKQMILDIKKLQASDIETSDVITRLESATGSFGIRVSEWRVINTDMGASFVLGHPVNGVLGSPAPSISGPNVVLGNFTAGSTVVASGGTWT